VVSKFAFTFNLYRYAEAENMKVVATGNLLLSVCIGFHYFIKVGGGLCTRFESSFDPYSLKPLGFNP
jgi:hypothetical protein